MLYHQGFLDSFSLPEEDLFNTPQEVLDGTDFAQVLGLEPGELLGHIVSIDALEAGDQVLFLVLRHQLQESGPFVLDPHSVEIFVIRAEGQHDFCAVQGGEDVGLVFHAQLIFQGDPGEEHPVALARQGVIDILSQHAVQGAIAILGGFLVADKNIVGLFVVGNGNDALADFLNSLCFFPVDLPGDGIGIF